MAHDNRVSIITTDDLGKLNLFLASVTELLSEGTKIQTQPDK